MVVDCTILRDFEDPCCQLRTTAKAKSVELPVYSHQYVGSHLFGCRVRHVHSEGKELLDLGLEIQTSGRTEVCPQRASRLDLPYGCRESELGSTAHSW